MISFFRKPSYVIRAEGDCVYCEWQRDITKWSTQESDRYLPLLWEAVKESVDDRVWTILNDRSSSEDPEYVAYVNKVRENLIANFELEAIADEVKLGLYHGDMLVISFPAKKGGDYPYYFQGIQIKPFTRKSTENG